MTADELIRKYKSGERDFREANLIGADLRGAKDGAIARLDFGGWSICVRSQNTTIGCQSCSNVKWLSWSPDSPEIAAMHEDAPEWWRVHGEAVKAVIRCVMEKANSEEEQGPEKREEAGT